MPVSEAARRLRQLPEGCTRSTTRALPGQRVAGLRNRAGCFFRVDERGLSATVSSPMVLPILDPPSDPPRPPSAAAARLLADVGGTNARFGWQARSGAPIVDVVVLRCADHATLADAISAYLRSLAGRPAPPQCAIAIATPIVGDQVTMTNHHWSFSISATAARFGFTTLRLLNDFTALALALPALRGDELRQVGGGAALAEQPIGLIGPGTGLGVSGLLPDGRGGWVPLQGEGGHVTLAGRTPLEDAVLGRLAERYGHASAERAVCGQGLVDIHRALQVIGLPDAPVLELDAAGITARALADGDTAGTAAGGAPFCRTAVDLFCGYLGTAAGNLALTLGTHGGVYVGGGIVPRLGTRFDRSPFRERFEAKGRFSGFLKAMPVFVIQARHPPALLGAARALDNTLR